jgi:hypothetical protein
MVGFIVKCFHCLPTEGGRERASTGHAHNAAMASYSIVATTHLPSSPYIRGFEGDATERSGRCLNREDYGALHAR